MVQYLNLMNPIFESLAAAIVKIAVWILPVFFLVSKVERKPPAVYLGLTSFPKKGVTWTLWICLAMVVYFIVIGNVMHHGVNLGIELDVWLSDFILVGITEEIVFRGYILKKFMGIYSFWKANIFTSLLFVSIHFPIWLYNGLFQFPGIISAVIQVFILSVAFGFIYKKTRSLWSVVIIHSVYDLLVSIFI